MPQRREKCSEAERDVVASENDKARQIISLTFSAIDISS